MKASLSSAAKKVIAWSIVDDIDAIARKCEAAAKANPSRAELKAAFRTACDCAVAARMLTWRVTEGEDLLDELQSTLTAAKACQPK